MNPRIWVAIVGGIAALDYWAARNTVDDDTLSEFTARTFHTHTLAGRIAFTTAWALLTAWFLPHVFNGGVRRR